MSRRRATTASAFQRESSDHTQMSPQTFSNGPAVRPEPVGDLHDFVQGFGRSGKMVPNWHKLSATIDDGAWLEHANASA
jgi:hypothetical protein